VQRPGAGQHAKAEHDQAERDQVVDPQLPHVQRVQQEQHPGEDEQHPDDQRQPVGPS